MNLTAPPGKRDIIIMGPLHDIPTTISYKASVYLRDWCKKNGYTYVFLPDGFVFNGGLRYIMERYPAPIISYLGHGDPDRLFGQIPPGDLLVKGVSEPIPEGINVHTMACLSARELGPYLINNGARSYFGSVDYMLGAFNEEEHPYQKDWVDMQTVIPRALLEGSTPREAFARYSRVSEKYRNQYRRMSDSWPNADWYIGMVDRNLTNYRLYESTTPVAAGNKGVTYQKPPVDVRHALLSFVAPIVAYGAMAAAPIVAAEAKKRM